MMDFVKSTPKEVEEFLKAPEKPQLKETVPWPIMLGWETEESLKENIDKYNLPL